MSRKAALLDLIDHIRQQEQTLIASLSDDQRAAQGQHDDWAIKDSMIHIALWDARLGDNLQAIAQGKPVTDYSDFETINTQDFETHRGDSWEQAAALLDESRKAIMDGLQALDDALLPRSDLLPGGEGRPTWNRIAGTAVIHPMLHLAEFYTASGKGQIALQLVEQTSDKLLELDNSPTWQGATLYNQACYHALAGHSGQALRLLKQALALDPELTEWSKEDPDLESLRIEPAYQALYETDASEV